MAASHGRGVVLEEGAEEGAEQSDSEEGECSSDDEDNSSDLAGSLEVFQEEEDEEGESGDRIEQDKLMQLG